MILKNTSPSLILNDAGFWFEGREYGSVEALSSSLSERQGFTLLIDSKSMSYTLDTLPDVPLLDRIRVRKNRLERLAQGGLLKGMIAYTPQKVGYGTLPKAPFLERALQDLEQAQIPIQVISFLPLEFIKLAPKEVQWSLLLYQNQTGAVRHLLVQNGQLVFTRVLENSNSFKADLESTLKYAERFNLEAGAGSIVQIGRFEKELPEKIMGVEIQKINPDNPVEAVVSKTLHKPLMKLSPNPFLKNYMAFRAPEWFKKFSIGYGALAVATSLLLFVNGFFDLKRQDDLEEKLEAVKLDLHHFEKTHKDLIEKVAFIKAYEREFAGYEDPLKTLKIIASQKPKTMILTKIKWEKPAQHPGVFELESLSVADSLSPKGHRKTHKRFYKSLQAALPAQAIEKIKQGARSPKKLLIAESSQSAKGYTPAPEIYTIRGARS